MNIANASQVAFSLGKQYKRLSSGWYSGPGLCHSSTKRDSTSMGFRDHDDGPGLAVKCWKGAGCPREQIIEAIEGATGLVVARRPRDQRSCPPPIPPRREPPPPPAGSKEATRTVEVPPDGDHPAHRWLARRNLWLPDAILPAGVRWLAERVDGRAGSIVAAGAPPEHWIDAWPECPRPTGVQLIRIDADGSPVLDKGELGKRSKGHLQDSICVLGDPRPEFATGAIAVEGLADGMSLAARRTDTVVVLFGTSTFTSVVVAQYLAEFRRVHIYRDVDVPGAEAANSLGNNVNLRRATPVVRVFVPVDGKDPAEVAAMEPPLPPGHPDERELAVDLMEEGLPTWEACRLAWTSLRYYEPASKEI